MIQDIESLKGIAGVYTIIHTASGRAYVGEAFNIRGRWKSHVSCLTRNDHRNYFLQQAWNKYGPQAFEFKKFIILERLFDESNYLLKKRLKQEENKVLALFPDNYNLEIPSSEHDYLIPGPAAKAQMKKAAKAERSTVAGKARMKRVRLEAMDDPIACLNHKLAIKAAWQNPEVKAARIAAFNTEQGQENRSQGAKLGWLKRKQKLQNDPEFLLSHQASREKANRKIKETYSTPEKREQLSKTSTESWKVEGRKEKVSASLKQFYEDPKHRKIHSERMKKAYKKED